MRSHRVDSIAIAVPVRDEEELLGRCLAGIAVAIEQLRRSARRPIDVAVAVVLDSCTDDSEAIARRFPFRALSAQVRNVGRVRALGVDAALEDLGGPVPEHCWIANTDADSLVPRDWLVRQVVLAERGWDLVLGGVRPDVASGLLHAMPPSADEDAAAPGTPRVYGANLGVRASAYRAVGGFPPLREHEDVRLVEALRASGARWTTSAATPVLTSARTVGRTPGGYAGYLRRNLVGDA